MEQETKKSITRTQLNNEYITEVNKQVYDINPNTRFNYDNSDDYREFRKLVFEAYQNKCCACGCTKMHLLQLDHIIPISVDPERCLDFENAQILCGDCNKKKGNRNTRRYKKKLKKEYCYSEHQFLLKRIKKNWSIYFKKIMNVDRATIFKMANLKAAGVVNDLIIEFDQLIYVDKHPSIPLIEKPFKPKTCIRKLAS